MEDGQLNISVSFHRGQSAAMSEFVDYMKGLILAVVDVKD